MALFFKNEMYSSVPETDIENRLMGMVVWGRRKEKMRSMETVIWKLTLPYVKLTANETCWMAQGNQTALGNNLEGWDGVEEMREAQERAALCIPMADSC